MHSVRSMRQLITQAHKSEEFDLNAREAVRHSLDALHGGRWEVGSPLTAPWEHETTRNRVPSPGPQDVVCLSGLS